MGGSSDAGMTVMSGPSNCMSVRDVVSLEGEVVEVLGTRKYQVGFASWGRVSARFKLNGQDKVLGLGQSAFFSDGARFTLVGVAQRENIVPVARFQLSKNC